MKTSVSMKVVLFGLAAAFMLAWAPATSAQPGEFVKGVLQPLADGFPKKPITIIVVDDPGTRDDLYAKSLQAALKGVSPVMIKVSDENSPVGGTFYTVYDILQREGGDDGYYVIVVSNFGVVTDLHCEPGTRELGAKLEDLKMVIYTEYLPYALMQRKNAPWGPTFAGMVKYGKENPGKLRYISYEVGSGHDITTEWLLNIIGLKVQKIPAGELQEVASIIGAGEGDFGINEPDIALQTQQAGRADVTMILGDVVPEAFKKGNPNAVSSKEAGIKIGTYGSEIALGVHAKVPQAHVDWLYKLFRYAATTPLHQQRAKTFPGLTFRIIDGATSDAENRQIYKDTEPVIRAIGLHMDQKK